MPDIRIIGLPLATGPSAPASSDVVALDGATTRKAPLSSLADVIRPLASQAEAEAGVNSVKGMSPLTTKQSIASEIGLTIQEYSDNLSSLGATAGDARNYLNVPTYAQTRAELKALSPGEDIVCFLLESDRDGFFEWSTGDYSALIALDIQEGVYIKSDSISASSGAWVRIGPPNVKNFGASSASDSSTAILAMGSLLGYVRFPAGSTLISSNLTSVYPLSFDEGAYVTVSSTFTFTVSASINSPRQFIFRGSGDVKLTIAASSGEDSRTVQASWFNVIPQNDDATDQSARINKMFSSMSQNREGVIDFDNGSYRISWDSVDPIPRGVWVRGCGVRRTTFDMIGSSTSASKLLRTGGVAVKITGIQFEHPEGDAASVHLGTAISLDHDDCYVEDVRCWDTQFGIVMNGARCEAHNIQSIYGVAMPSDSALIKAKFGGCVVDTVRVSDTTFGPSAIVQVGGTDATLEIRNARVSNVRTNKNSIGVQVYSPSGVTVQGLQIDGIMNTGNEASPVTSLVNLVTAGTGNIQLVSISDLLTNGTCASLVRIDQGSSGFTRDVVMSTGVAIGSGNGIVLNQTAGSLTDITISDSIDVDDRTVRVQRTGSMSNIKIGALVSPDNFTIADDQLAIIPIPGPTQTCVFSVSTSNGPDATAPRGLFFVRGQSGGAQCSNLSMVSTTNITFTTGVLAAGGGADGNVTFSAATDGNLYVSNRSGASRTMGFQPFSPI